MAIYTHDQRYFSLFRYAALRGLIQYASILRTMSVVATLTRLHEHSSDGFSGLGSAYCLA